MHHSMFYGLHIYIFDNVNLRLSWILSWWVYVLWNCMCHITDHSVSERNTISSPKSLRVRAFVCLLTLRIEMVQESSFSVSKETASCGTRVPKTPPSKIQLPTPWKPLHQWINQNEISKDFFYFLKHELDFFKNTVHVKTINPISVPFFTLP